jgi:hypothetical protein
MEGWRGLGDAALAGGTLQESDEAFHRYVELARRAGNVGEIAAGSTGLGEYNALDRLNKDSGFFITVGASTVCRAQNLLNQ